MKKFISLLLAGSMLLASTAALAYAPSYYDGTAYTTLGLDSDDEDGEINLAVIAASDVTLGNTMYIQGSVYANGTISVIDGAGNTVDGLFISKTGNTTYTGATGEYTAEGYKIVDSNGTDETTTMYDSKPNYNGAIYDANTSFECEYTDYEVPEIDNTTAYYYSAWDSEKTLYKADTSGTVTASTYNQVYTVNQDTHFGSLAIGNDGFVIDATDGPIDIVIDNFIMYGAGGDGYWTVLGDNEVNVYINNIIAANDSNKNSNLIKLYTQNAENAIDTINDTSYDYFTLSDDFDAKKQQILDASEGTNINFYLDCDDSFDTISIQGSFANANIITGKNLTISSTTAIIGDFTVGGNFSLSASTVVWGTVCAPNSKTFIGQAAILYGQLHTYTLDMAGAGAIMYQSDSITTSATEEPTTTDSPSATTEATEEPSSGVTLDIVEDVVYIVYDMAGNPDASLTINHSGAYHWEYVYEDGVSYSSGVMTDADGEFNSYYDTSGSHTADTATSSTAYLSSGQYYILKAVSNEDSSVYDTVKIIVVASEDDIPAATATPTVEPTEAPELPEGTEIDLSGAGYAYIFGYEPYIYSVDTTDGEGNVISTEVYASVEMAPDDAVTREQVAAMIMRMVDQAYNTTGTTYELTSNMSQHEGTWYARGLAYLASKGTFDGIDYVNTGAVTRGEVAKLVAYGLNLSDTTETEFTDIEDNEYKDYIEIMAAYGYMNGVSATSFEPDRVMTRAEFCSMFNNIIGRDTMGLNAEDGTIVTQETYSIVDLDGHWAEEVMLKATSAYDDDGYVDIDTRVENIRNKLDNYAAQLLY
ncbi:MAG: S-layer homology domain-containing protein [Firmicutes bacterium]|nr:S-layer homology domain-containing protein [Bacillota bacterium]